MQASFAKSLNQATPNKHVENYWHVLGVDGQLGCSQKFALQMVLLHSQPVT